MIWGFVKLLSFCVDFNFGVTSIGTQYSATDRGTVFDFLHRLADWNTWNEVWNYVQTMVTRLSDPYGECEDPSDVDKNLNAYAEHYPVEYTAHVCTQYIGLYSLLISSIKGRSHICCALRRCAGQTVFCVLLAQRSNEQRSVCVNGPLCFRTSEWRQWFSRKCSEMQTTYAVAKWSI